MPFGLIGSIFNSITGSNSQRETNDTNYRINQMNNEFNAREAEKAFQREVAYNDRIRAEDREYNSASAQVERYRQAGLNPSIMMQGQGAGIATSNGVSSPAASASSPGYAQAYQPNINTTGIGNAVLAFLDMKQRKELQDEQINGLRIENQYKAAEIFSRIANNYADVRNKDARAKLDKTLEGLQDQIVQNQTLTAEAQAEQARTTSMLNLANAFYRMKEFANFDQKFREESAMRVAQTAM